MKLEFEYGQGLLGAELARQHGHLLHPGETVADPPCLPQDWGTACTPLPGVHPQPHRHAPLKRLAGPGQDRSSSFRTSSRGTRPTSHRKVAIRACLDEAVRRRGGAEGRLLRCSPTACTPGHVAEMQTILAPSCSASSTPISQITSRDSEDYDHLVDLGYTAQGDHGSRTSTSMTRTCGAHRPHPGQPMAATRRLQALRHRHLPLAEHLCPPRAPGDAPAGFVPVSTNSEMRHTSFTTSRACGWRRRWARNSSLLTLPCWTPRAARSRSIPGWPGDAPSCPGRWRTSVPRLRPLGGEEYDIIVFGMPTNFHYGNGMGTSPHPDDAGPVRPGHLGHRRIASDRCVSSSPPSATATHDERLALPAGSCTTCSSTTMNILPRHEPVRRVLRHQGVSTSVSTASPTPSTPSTASMMSRAIWPRSTPAPSTSGRPRPGIARKMGPQTRATFEEAPGRRHASTPAQPQHPWPCPHLPAVHLCMKGRRPEGRLSGEKTSRSPSGDRTAAGLQRGLYRWQIPVESSRRNGSSQRGVCRGLGGTHPFAFWRTDMRPMVSMQKVRK